MSKNRTDFEGVKNIVLDVGGILVGYRWYDMLKSHGFSHEEIMDFADTVFPDPLWVEFDLENVPYDHVVNQYIEKYPRLKAQIECFFYRSQEMVVPRPDVWDRVRDLSSFQLFQRAVPGASERRRFLAIRGREGGFL